MNELKKRAEQTLKKTAQPFGFVAGTTHFNDLWARDSLYASWGAINIGFYRPVKHTLATLALHQREDGLIPIRVGNKHILLPLLGIQSTKGPKYQNDKTRAPALDSNSLYIITLGKYYKATKDKEFLKEHLETLSKALEYLKSKTKNDLLKEKPYASWDDAIKKRGASTYNNTLYIAALKTAYNLTKKKKYLNQAQRTYKELRKNLWRKNYFQSHEGCTVFDVPANLLTIYLGVTTTKEKKKILHYLQKQKKREQDILPKTNYPKYKWNEVYTPFYLIGMKGYHNQGPYWTWIASLEAAITRDQKLLETLNKHIAFNDSIHEILTTQGDPWKNRFYKSEQDFSWTAGMLLL